jgi:CO/xanthine dehydrogenase Mo-binding subunit
MLRAVIEKAPTYGGRPAKVDASRALAVPGVRHVVTIDGLPNPTRLRPGVAVLADTTWAAMQGREALAAGIEWTPGPSPAEGTESLSRRFAELARSPGKRLRDGGDVGAAFAGSRRVFDAVYEFPFLAHATLEPMNCIADVRDGRCEIRGPMQMPDSAQRVVAEATGLPAKAIRIHVTPWEAASAGGSSDYVGRGRGPSQKVGRPVQVVWTREDDMRNDYYRPAGRQGWPAWTPAAR